MLEKYRFKDVENVIWKQHIRSPFPREAFDVLVWDDGVWYCVILCDVVRCCAMTQWKFWVSFLLSFAFLWKFPFANFPSSYSPHNSVLQEDSGPRTCFSRGALCVTYLSKHESRIDSIENISPEYSSRWFVCRFVDCLGKNFISRIFFRSIFVFTVEVRVLIEVRLPKKCEIHPSFESSHCFHIIIFVFIAIIITSSHHHIITTTISTTHPFTASLSS